MSPLQAVSGSPVNRDPPSWSSKTSRGVQNQLKRKRSLTEEHLDRNNTIPKSFHKRRCDRSFPREVIDLTTNVQRCALCSDVLGDGDGRVAGIYLIYDCRCVICGQCALGNILGEGIWCSRYNHFDFGRQKVNEIFSLDCQICWENASEKSDRLYQEMLASYSWLETEPNTSSESALRRSAYHVERVSTRCGHIFCRECIVHWIESRSNDNNFKCPVCRKQIPRDVSDLKTFDTVQCDVIYQPDLAVEGTAGTIALERSGCAISPVSETNKEEPETISAYNPPKLQVARNAVAIKTTKRRSLAEVAPKRLPGSLYNPGPGKVTPLRALVYLSEPKAEEAESCEIERRTSE